MDVPVPQDVEQLFVVPQISSQTAFCSVPSNMFLAVPVPRMTEQFVDVLKIVSQDRTQQRTLEQIVHHVVNTVNAECPGSSRSLCSVKKSPVNQVTKHAVFLQVATARAAWSPRPSTHRWCTSNVLCSPTPNQPFGWFLLAWCTGKVKIIAEANIAMHTMPSAHITPP